MDKCPSCGQPGSIDPIALASGPLTELRAQRCAACEQFWLAFEEMDRLGDDELFGPTARDKGWESTKLCQSCGGVLNALAAEGAFCCESCRIVLLDERGYDQLDLSADSQPAV